MERPEWDPTRLIALARYTMPFGRFAGRYLKDVPEEYLLWLTRRDGLSVSLMHHVRMMLALKENGLERLLDPLVEPEASHGEPRSQGSPRARPSS